MVPTGCHSTGPALARHDAGHVVSVVNPAQVRDLGRIKLGCTKPDQVDAALIRNYAELFKPGPWTPPSPAMRQLCELQAVRAGSIASRTEWRNNNGLGDSAATKLAAMTIDGDAGLRGRRDLLRSVIGIGETLAAMLLAETPEHRVLRRSGEVAA